MAEVLQWTRMAPQAFMRDGVRERIRVVNIIEEGRLGGPQVRIVRVAEALRGCVDTVVVMPEEGSEDFQGRCKEAGVKYVVLRMAGLSRAWQRLARYVVDFRGDVARLGNVLRDGGFDLVHVSGGSWQWKGLMAAQGVGLPVVWHLNDTRMPPIVRVVARRVGRKASGVIFASHRSRLYYDKILSGIKVSEVVPAPVDPAEFDPSKEYTGEEDLIASWGDDIVIGTVANVSPVKGLEILIRAASRLRAWGRGLRFVVVGATFETQRRYRLKLEEELVRRDVRNFEFVGPRADVRPLLKRFDIFVCSSWAESSPVAVWEAMAMGRAIVSTDVGDVPRYILHGENGYVIRAGDDAALAKFIGRLVCSPERRTSFGMRARQRACEEFSPEIIAKKTWGVYKAVLSLG